MNPFEPNQEMLNNYIQNKLSPADTEALELWLADHPEAMQDLELDLMFKQGLSEELSETDSIQKQGFNILDILASKKLLPVHLIAYGLMAVLLVNTYSDDVSMRSQNSTSASIFKEFEITRSASSVLNIETVESSKNYTFRFFVNPSSDSKYYKFVMSNLSTDEELVVDNIVPQDNDNFTVSISSEKYFKGKWELLIFDDTNKSESEFSVNIR
jgi:hypothetical protein